jgi:hypothetical protein
MTKPYQYGYRTPRFAVDFPCLLQTEGANASTLPARCLDISEDGIAVQLGEYLSVGDHVTLVLTLPGAPRPQRIAAQVSNRQGKDHGMTLLFDSPQQQADLQTYLLNYHSDPVALKFRPK